MFMYLRGCRWSSARVKDQLSNASIHGQEKAESHFTAQSMFICIQSDELSGLCRAAVGQTITLVLSTLDGDLVETNNVTETSSSWLSACIRISVFCYSTGTGSSVQHFQGSLKTLRAKLRLDRT